MPTRIWRGRTGGAGSARARATEEERARGERTCLTVIAGFHAFSSFKIDKQTVPDG